MVGDLQGYGTVWYHPKGIANILSLHRVAKQFRVTFDSEGDNAFIVWNNECNPRRFIPGPRGLYFCDMTSVSGAILTNYGITTVDGNKSNYTQRQIKSAEHTRKMQDTIGATTDAMIRIVDNKMMLNCPADRSSINDAVHIFGPSTANLQGKSTRRTQDHVVLQKILHIPPIILSRHKNVILGMDVVTVNGVRFFDTYSRDIKFSTVSEIEDAKIPTLVKLLKYIKCIYAARGFNIVSIAADNAFEPMKTDPDFVILNIALNVCSADEHEPFIERFNRTLKERCRMCYATLPFKRMPRQMIVNLVYLQTFWINFYIPREYISTTLSPGTIVGGRNYDYNLLLGPGTQFGEYVQTTEKTTNTMRLRTVGAITMRPTGNSQGSFYYFSLLTGRRLHRKKCTPLPMPQTAIARIHAMASKQKLPDGLAFLHRNGTIPIAPILIVDNAAPDDESAASKGVGTNNEKK